MSDAGSRKSSMSKEPALATEIEVIVQNVDDGEIDPYQIRHKEFQPKSETRTSRQETQERYREKRRMIVDELLQTERDYVRNLQQCRDAFLKNPGESKAHGINVDALFGYVDPVLSVNNALLASLEDTLKMQVINQNIGNCFQQVAADMKKVYGDYCANHDDVINLLEKYEENSETSAFIQGKLGVGSNPSFFSLSSVLIKPVQRVLKYPLLLNELVKVTETDNPGKPDLLTALKVMTDVADEINECKRRKDLVVKYRKETDGGLTAKISKLSIHSVVKKSQRIGMRLSSHLGLASVTKDVAFDEIEQKFRDVERTVRQLLKDTEFFCNNLEECVLSKFNLAEHIANYYEDQRTRKDVDSFRTIQRNIRTTVWPEFKTTVEVKLIKPLTALLHLYEGPNKLIEKRNDKLLDYDSASQRVEKNKDVNRGKQLREELQQANKNYSALNSRLLEELPKLVQLSIEILVECIGAFLAARRRFIGHATNQLFELTEQIPALAPADDVLATFCEKHADIVNWMTSTGIIHKEFQSSPRTERASKDKEKASGFSKGQGTDTSVKLQRKPQKPICQSSSQKAYLQGRYPKESLFCATQPHTPTNDMELSLNAGDLVAIIKQKDPMGGTQRWFVDNGSDKGFVPSSILAPLPVNLVPPSPSMFPTSPQTLRKNEENWTAVESTSQYRNYYDTVPPDNERQFRYENAPFEGFELMDTNGSRYDLPSDYDSAVTGDEMESALRFPQWLEQNGQIVSSADTGPFEDPSVNQMNPTETAVHTQPSEADSENEQNPYHYATFAFTANGPNELSLAQGQVVLVRHKQDLQGNPEWWYVEDRYGNQGYAPANYLVPYPMGTE